MDKLYEHNSSFQRIFKNHELNKLKNTEIKKFYYNIFNQKNIRYSESAIKEMVIYCKGFPLIMQEVGDAVFWNMAKDNEIDNDAVVKGLIMAKNRIKLKYSHSILK